MTKDSSETDLSPFGFSICWVILKWRLLNYQTGKETVLMLLPGLRCRVLWLLPVQFVSLPSSAACFAPHFCNSFTSIIVEELGAMWPLAIKFSSILAFRILRKNLRLCIPEKLVAWLSLSCLSHSHQTVIESWRGVTLTFAPPAGYVSFLNHVY